MKSIAERVVHAREHAGLTQATLAAKSGVSQGTIGNIESGLRKRPREIVRIAKALNVTPHWLETGSGPMSASSPPEPEWPFEMLTRKQWAVLSERQRGVIESAAVAAYRSLSGSPPVIQTDTDALGAALDVLQPEVRRRIYSMLLSVAQDPETHLKMMSQLLPDRVPTEAPEPSRRKQRA